jgi:hypothetical protein
MEIRWEEIPDDVFEELVAALLRALGYANVVVRTGGADDGWDVDAELVSVLPDGTLRVERWRVECKRYRGTVPAEKVRDHYHRMCATPPLPHGVLFVTTASLSNPAKQDLLSFSARDRVQVQWWEREELTRLSAQHLADPALAGMLASHVESLLPWALLQEAASRQVAGEIERRVGRKYIPHLYRARELDEELQAFLSSVRETPWPGDVARYAEEMAPVAREQGLVAEWDNAVSALWAASSWEEALRIFAEITSRLDPATAHQMRQMAMQQGQLNRTCFLIRDRAGSGKTNLLCSASTRAQSRTLSLLLSCRFDLREASGLETLVLSALQAAVDAVAPTPVRLALPRDTALFFQALLLTLKQERAQLVVFLDGINENRDLQVLDEAVVSLLQRWNTQPVLFVVTCRDIFWEFFRTAEWQPFLHRARTFSLSAFSSEGIDGLIQAYFAAFGIRGRLQGVARDRCRHPLLLRFFCEAYRGQDIRVYEDLRLKDLFDTYWARKRAEISASLGLGGGGERRVETFILDLVSRMVADRATQMRVGEIERVTSEDDLESQHSLYRRLLDEDVILEELPPADAFDRGYDARKVAFVYDEFYDYVAALAHVRHHDWDALAPKAIVTDFLALLDGTGRFEQLVGVAEYLVLIGEAKGLHRPFCAALARLGSFELLCSVLPKLRDVGPWMEKMLGSCFLAIGRSTDSGRFLPSRALRPDELRRALERGENRSDLPLDEWILKAPLDDDAPNPSSWWATRPTDPLGDLRVEWLGTALEELEPGLPTADLRFAVDALRAQFHPELSEIWTLEAPNGPFGTGAKAAKRIAETIWVLWGEEASRVWEVLRGWGTEGEQVKMLSHAVLEAGFATGRLSAEEALRKLGDWLTRDDPAARAAAERLLPAITSDTLISASSEWGAGKPPPYLDAVPRVMSHLFSRSPLRAVEMLMRWAAEKPPHLIGAVTATLQQLTVPETWDTDQYRLLEKHLLALKVLIGRESDPGQRRIEHLVRQVRVIHSRLSEAKLESGRLPQYRRKRT